MDTYDEMERFSARRAEGLCALCGVALDELPAPDAAAVAAYLCAGCRERTGASLGDGPVFGWSSQRSRATGNARAAGNTGQRRRAAGNARAAVSVHRALAGSFAENEERAVFDLLADLGHLCAAEGYDMGQMLEHATALWQSET